MKLVLLGTSGYHPTEARHTMCLMIPEHGIILDAGTGMHRVPQFTKTAELDVFLTHTHLDHVEGLPYLMHAMRAHDLQRVTIHARDEKIRAIDEHLFNEHFFPIKPPYEYRPLESKPLNIGGAQATHFPLQHPGGAVGYRFQWQQQSLAYVSDTIADPNADYVREIEDVDLLIHECYVPDGDADWAHETGHSFTSAVAKVARAANVGMLLLVHISPELEHEDSIDIETAQTIFPNTMLGCDLMEVEF